MAIGYGIVFHDVAPVLIEVLQKTVNQNKFELTLDKDGVGYWLASSKETFLYIRPVETHPHLKTNILEFSFGLYSYQANWYIRCGADSYGGMLILLAVVKELILTYSCDFLCLVNGERIVLRKEHSKVFLNQKFGSWNTKDVQDILSSVSYELADYPVV